MPFLSCICSHPSYYTITITKATSRDVTLDVLALLYSIFRPTSDRFYLSFFVFLFQRTRVTHSQLCHGITQSGVADT
jgi:hypothetical protein